MVTLSPILKLDDRKTFGVLGALSLDLVVVRLQDLICKRTFKFNETYRQIVSQQGLHNFLNFNGKILLSLIMKDQIIANLNPERYSEAIHSLKPDSFTTVDGETYEGEFVCSTAELERITKENNKLLDLASDFKPVGLVKGCSEVLIKNHAQQLKSKGIDEYIFHVSDFLRNGGKPDLINKARLYALTIRPFAKNLILYGVGSSKLHNKFSFADKYVTFTHFINATHRKKVVGNKIMTCLNAYNENTITENFINMYYTVESLEKQQTM